ncbi:fumarylacetoacetate hydrolase family protein [Alteraurantiacibacter aestuarii]|uniref:Fumarylacetoacetate hydrolase n=1 Tax=Alteraurantiacibacter aestuarii TaxID=650004 RepID=A0A844ZJC2_9SPHN|nr:fumarylacetoacetate hydrolase family protein [Alteraurantiacibacter aestuarii]MXO87246.1 fumarylacetoacetate hydrolase [Alteraurantiacibacter aestuarii]
MRLATLANGTPDGELVVVSADGKRFLAAGERWPNLLAAFTDWQKAEPALRATVDEVEQGAGGKITAQTAFRAPMPRAWQWLDGSVFSTHARLMEVAFNTDPIENQRPLMYQGQSDRFYGPTEDVPFGSEADGIDFEGEFGVIVDHVPMGCTPAEAMERIRLLVQINDWSLRAYAVPEMKTGFGFILAKPACSVAPFAVTPDELHDGWRDGRVCLDLQIDWNGKRFGSANGREMDVGFHELVAQAATTRDLVAGTIIGSGTVANAGYAEVGSSCISERRAIEIIADGKPTTGFMSFGDHIRMAGVDAAGGKPFGAIDQQVVCRP